MARVPLYDETGAYLETIEIDPAQKTGGWSAYPKGVVWALAKRKIKFGGANLLFAGDVPLASGLSSSAAFEVCVGFLLNELFGLGLERLASGSYGR